MSILYHLLFKYGESLAFQLESSATISTVGAWMGRQAEDVIPEKLPALQELITYNTFLIFQVMLYSGHHRAASVFSTFMERNEQRIGIEEETPWLRF